MLDLNQIDPSVLWYVVGYFASDGSLSIDGRHLNITSKDNDHLNIIRKVLKLNSKIGRKSRSSEQQKKYFYLQFSDVNFYKYLVKIGFTSNKSLTLGEIKISKNYFNDFLRGVIDGDGSISTWIHHTNRNRQWSLRVFSGSHDFICWLQEQIKKKFNIEGKMYKKLQKNRVNPIYILKFGKKDASKILIKVYYTDCLALERKYLSARLCLQS